MRGNSRRARAIPKEIYASQVEALYGDAQSLYIGLAAAVLVAIIAAVRSGEPLLAACTIAIVATGAARSYNMRSFREANSTHIPAEAIRGWEWRYVTGATLHVAILGAFCFVSFWKTTDAFIQLLSFSTLLAVMIGVSGRNFSSSLLVDSNIVCAAVPMVAAMAVVGGAYWFVVVLVLVPFFLSLRTMATRLRGIFFDAVVRAHDLSLLAGRFDTALNNMPQGLAMFDERQGLVVVNRRFAELFRLPEDRDFRGDRVQDILLASEKGGLFAPTQTGDLTPAFESRLLGQTRGALLLETEQRRSIECSFQPMDGGGSVLLAQDVTERKTAEARISHLARYDTLTGIPNRNFLSELLEVSLKEDQGTSLGRAILFIDLDRFKQVNDTLGHSVGDKLLCEVSNRLRGLLKASDLTGRFGGDEFVLVRVLQHGQAEAEAFSRRVIETLSRPYEIDQQRVVIGASIGLALTPFDGMNVDELLRNADMALYRAKADGRGTFRFFEAEMDVQARALRSMEMDMRKAVAEEGFELFYQPVFDLRARRFSCCEALIRWRHPERGMISPLEFVPLAESTGLIVEIGAWVLREACLECATWPEHLSVAVNISPEQFRRGGLVKAVCDALAAAKLAPHRLQLEITESLLLQNMDSTAVTLSQLRNMGVCISLDDFGTGYSSLSYLHSLPFQKIKIDQSFVRGLGESERSLVLLRGVARLSADLGMVVVAEGVETERQLALVASEGLVDEVQGYLFSRPLVRADIRRLLGCSEDQLSRVA
jgi:diguanylate cyclase (GGDEF)-like protein